MINLFYNYKTKDYFKNIIEQKNKNHFYLKYVIKKNNEADFFYNNYFINNIMIGYSFNTNFIFLKNKFNKKIKFIFLKNTENNDKLKYKIKNFLTRIISNKKILFLKPLKNGIQVYSNGILGILPIKDYFNLVLYNNIVFFDFLINFLKNYNKKYSFLKLYLPLKNLSFYLFSQKGIFLKNTSFLKRRVTFIFKFHKLNDIKETNNKKIKKYYFRERNKNFKIYNFKSQFFKQHKFKIY